MASTSLTNATTESRTPSDRDERGITFFLGRWPLTLVAPELGRQDGDGPAASPRRERAHAAGHRP